ncbi:MAG: hypothetical protein P4L38_12700 [Syntrophaceae bacterium]|nr:hypothetical protein [Syntrophaceae bacterium]
MFISSSQKEQIANAIEGAVTLLADDKITHVSSVTGVSTEITCMLYDSLIEAKQGIKVDKGGIRDQDIREAVITKAELTAKSVTINAADHFLIESERWDFSEKDKIQTKLVPIVGIHNIVRIRLRRAVELNHTQSGSSFSWEPV